MSKPDIYGGLKLTPKTQVHKLPSAETSFIEAGEPQQKPSREPSDRVVVYLPRSLSQWVRHKCVDEHRSVSEYLVELVRAAQASQ